jgi:hypothetical protein
MRRMVYLFITVCALHINQSNAQLLRSFGAKIAVTSASQRIDYTPQPPWSGFTYDVDRRTGVNAAIYAEWLNVPFFSVITQIEYAQRGFTEQLYFTEDASSNDRTTTRDNRVDYLSLPILLKASASTGDISPYILIGPRLDAYLGYHDKFNEPNSMYDRFKKTIWGGSAGVGIDFRSLIPVSVSLEVRYNVDFIDSYNDGTIKIRNNAYDFWLGVAL